MYLVKNISGKVQSMPKTLDQFGLSAPGNNWAIGQTDEVVDELIDRYSGHTDAFTVLSGPSLHVASGTVPAASITAGVTVSDGDGGVNKTVLTLTNVSVATTDVPGTGAYGSIELYDFPVGLIYNLGGTSNLTVSRVGTGITATASVVGAVGSVAAAADATLTSTEADMLPSTAATLTAGAGTLKAKSTATEATFKDGTSTAIKAYLNFAMNDASSGGDDALLVNGTITLLWMDAGDN
jgi:hypothetical protein